MNGLPSSGKIVVLPPKRAAFIAGQAPHLANRIFTIANLPEDKGYIIDIDRMDEEMKIKFNRQPTLVIRGLFDER